MLEVYTQSILGSRAHYFVPYPAELTILATIKTVLQVPPAFALVGAVFKSTQKYYLSESSGCTDRVLVILNLDFPPTRKRFVQECLQLILIKVAARYQLFN